jgi:DNA-binding transcriptional regulator PaaX
MSTETYQQLIAQIPVGLDGELVRILSGHVGYPNAIGRGKLVEIIRLAGKDVNERVVRQAIHDLRRAGYLICSAPGEDGGYYMAGNLDEFDDFIARELHPKAMDMLETEKAMKESARQQFGEAVQLGML